jgi:hypothetical protein
VWDEAWVPGADTVVVAKEIREACEVGRRKGASPYSASRFGRFVLHPDPSGRSRHSSSAGGVTDHSLLRDHRFSVRARGAAPSLRDRYNATNSMFRNGAGSRRVHIHPRCKHLVRCLEGLLYREGTNRPDEQKCRDMTHITDALGYWLEFEFPVRYGAAVEHFSLSDLRVEAP